MSSVASPRSPLEIVVPVCLAGAAAVGLSVATLAPAAARPELTGPLILLALAAAAEHFPVPAGLTTISFSSVFVVAAAVIFGAEIAALLAALAVASSYATFEGSKPPVRMAFNISVGALTGGAAGVAAAAFGGILPSVIAAAVAFFAVNVILIGSVIARFDRRPLVPLLNAILRWVSLPFALAISIVPLFVLAWESSKLVAVSGAVPLAAVGLYLRSLALTKRTLELALTDPLTGLGNRRHFDERLRGELDRADDGAGPMSLVLIDLDRLKSVNDRFGHDAGDELLRAVAACLRQGGEAFRFGGDEFAILLPGRTARDAGEIVQAVRERIASVEAPDGTSAQAGFGVSTYPDSGVARDDLVRSADRALYREKQSSARTA